MKFLSFFALSGSFYQHKKNKYLKNRKRIVEMFVNFGLNKNLEYAFNGIGRFSKKR